MERNSYSFYTFFSEVVFGWKCIQARAASIYYLDNMLWKVFRPSFPANLRYETYVDSLAKLDSNILTIPRKKLYLDDEYYGYLMDHAGISLDKYWKENVMSLDNKIDILLALKYIVKYLKALGLVHSDIGFSNVLIREENGSKQIRLGDVNSIIFSEREVNHLNVLHNLWLYFYKDINVLDKLAFDFLTFILINFDALEYADIIRTFKDNSNTGFDILNEVNYILDFDKGYFKEDAVSLLKRDLIIANLEKKLNLPDTYLIDCLK